MGDTEEREASATAGELAPPLAPHDIAATGLTADSLLQLLVKTLYAGEQSGHQLSDRMRVPYSVIQALVDHVRVERLVEVRGTSGAGSAGYRYALTDLGRDRARQFFDVNTYVGPAPVPLTQYVERMQAMA